MKYFAKKIDDKLYLASRDIQVGDKLHNGLEITYDNLCARKTLDPNNEWFKIIGEISPEATWVEEGDEFEPKEVAWNGEEGTEEVFLLNDEFSPIPKDYKEFIYIKGPCGHFH